MRTHIKHFHHFVILEYIEVPGFGICYEKYNSFFRKCGLCEYDQKQETVDCGIAQGRC